MRNIWDKSTPITAKELLEARQEIAAQEDVVRKAGTEASRIYRSYEAAKSLQEAEKSRLGDMEYDLIQLEKRVLEE